MRKPKDNQSGRGIVKVVIGAFLVLLMTGAMATAAFSSSGTRYKPIPVNCIISTAKSTLFGSAGGGGIQWQNLKNLLPNIKARCFGSTGGGGGGGGFGSTGGGGGGFGSTGGGGYYHGDWK